MKTLTTIFTCFLLRVAVVSSQLDPEDEAKVDEFMEGLMECRGMPGASIALVKDNEVVLTRGYGFANMERQEPVTEDTVFAIASVSKSFTATLFAKIFSETTGLDWDSVIAWSSEDVVAFYDGYVTNHTMFRDLLSHQTGITRHDAMWILEALDTRDEITQRSHLMNQIYEFRTDFLYNNIMYTLASHPIEMITSSSFEELLREMLLNPIGMDTTTFYDEAEETGYAGFATPYNLDITTGNLENLTEVSMDAWRGSYLVGPAASVCSSAKDMGSWMRFILNDGVTADGTTILNSTDITRLWYAESSVRSGSPSNVPVLETFESYGLSYSNGHYRGYQKHSHGGDLPGFHSEIYFLPSMNISTFFTSNFGGITDERLYIHQFLADILLGIEPDYNVTTVCELLERQDKSLIVNPGMSDTKYLPKNTMNVLNVLGFDDNVINFLASEQVEGVKGMPKSLAIELSNIIERVVSGGFTPEHTSENYTGIYGNFYFGNLTISLSEECSDCLFVEYGKLGRFTLYPTEEQDTFIGTNELNNLAMTPVIFSGVDETSGSLSSVSPWFFDLFNPPVFERGLSMDDAPPPNIDSC